MKLRLPPSLSSVGRSYVSENQQYLFEEESDVNIGLSQQMKLSIPFHVYPQLMSTLAFVQVLQQRVFTKERPYALEYPITLKTMTFFTEWTPSLYMQGIFSNASYWNDLQDYYEDRCTRPQLFLIVAMANKSHLWILPFLRNGHVTSSFLQRCKTWFSQQEIYGFFPLYYQLDSPKAKKTKASYQQFLTDILPRLSKKDIEQGIEQFCQELDALFREAPSLSESLIVYRGIKQSFPSTWTDPGYVSTTLHPLHAFQYKSTSPSAPCCVQRLVIPPSIKVLFLEGISNFQHEWEILLPRGLTYQIIQEGERQVPMVGEWHLQNPSRYQTVRLQDVRIRVSS